MKNRKVGFEIKMLNNLIKRKVESSPVKKKVDNMTGTHTWIIGYIAEHDDNQVFQKDLEKEFNVRRSTVTGILNLMENNGLIKREKVEYDARLKKIVLTEKSIEIHNLITQDIKNIEDSITKDISEEELVIFYRILDKIKKNLSN